MRGIGMLVTVLLAAGSTHGETFLLKGGAKIYGVLESKDASWVNVRTSYGRVRFKKGELKKKLTRGKEHNTLYVEEARVSAIKGSAWTSDDGGKSWRRIPWKSEEITKAAPKEFPPRIRAGEMVKTGPESSLGLDVGWGAVLLDADTTLQMQKTTGATLRLKQGRIAARLEDLPKMRRFRIETSQASMGVVGTRFVVTAGRETRVAVLHGKVKVGGQSVPEGRAVVVRGKGKADAEDVKPADRAFGARVQGVLVFPLLEWTYLAPARFDMGGEDDPNYPCQGVPRRAVYLKPFLLGRYEVSQGEYGKFRAWVASHGDVGLRGADRRQRVEYRSGGAGGFRPLGWEEKSWGEPEVAVYAISWKAARGFCRWMGGRLPSEAEWEYAARAGSSEPRPHGKRPKDLNKRAWTLYNSGRDEYAPFDSEVGFDEQRGGEPSVEAARAAFARRNVCRPRPGGLKPPNAFGFHDMLGNAAEWVADTASPNYEGAPTDGSAWVRPGTRERVYRGGSFYGYAYSCSPVVRMCGPEKKLLAGVRVARDIP